MASEPERTPPSVRTFAVGVTANGISGGGHLEVGPNLLVCDLGPIAKRVAGIERVQHKGTVVQVYRARLIPFWFNVAAVIDDGATVVGASMWSFGLKTLVKCLTAAGFDVNLHRTWFFRGLRYSEMLGQGKTRRAGPS